jgi:GGDEF domain-containing protein
MPALPWWVPLPLGIGATITGAWTVAGRISGRRRSGRAMSALDAGGSAGEALRAAGIDCWAVWLEFRRESFEYEPRVEGDVLPDADDLSELCKRALRPGSRGRRGSLASGVWFEITEQDGTGVRLAVGGPSRLSSFESDLVGRVAVRTRATAAGASRPSLSVVGGDARRGGAWHPAVIVIELNAFENVRMVAGQLSAERVETEAVTRLRTLLRDGDHLHRLGEDRFALVVPITEQSQIEGVCRRVDAALSSVPVPHRAEPIKPVMRTYVHGEIAADPQLAALIDQEHPSESRKAG